ncbi:MAG: sigma-70 family RNA polymerase sigma factor [Pikeienuella sp.]
MSQNEPPSQDGGRGHWSSAQDEALIRAVAAGRDKVAFAELFSRYAGRVKAFLLKGGAPESTAEEAAQEVMILLWRRATLFDPGKASAATWIFTIARNKRIDLARRDARSLPNPDDPALSPEPTPAAEREVAGAERDARVRAALAALSEEQREVVRLAFFSDRSHADIAQSLGLPLGTVKSRLRLAFQRLRSELGSTFALELTDD